MPVTLGDRLSLTIPHARRRILAAAGASVVVLGLASVVALDPHGPGAQGGGLRPAAAAVSGRPNIVVIMADDMRVDDLAYAPNVHALLQQDGVTMQNSFSSYPLCCPARASFLSGQLPRNHHVWSHKSPWGYGAFDDSSTIGTAMQQAGYATGFAGKYLNGYGTALTSADGGAEVRDWSSARARHLARKGYIAARLPIRTHARIPSFRKIPAGWTDWRATMDLSPRQRRLVGLSGGTYDYADVLENDNGVPVSYPHTYSSNVIGQQAIDMVTRFSSTPRPFFVEEAFVGPHCGSGDRGEQRRDARDGMTGAGSETSGRFCTPAAPAADRGIWDSSITHGAGVLANGMTETDANGDGRDTAADTADKPHLFGTIAPLSRRDLVRERDDTRQRAEAVYALDVEVGRMIETLKRLGRWENTIVVFTSDNGFFQGEHHRREGKVLAYEPALRVPIVITGPGLRGQGAQHRYDPMDFVALTRTLVDAAGATPPHTPDGESMLPVLEGSDQGWDTAIPIEQAWTVPSGDAQALLHHRAPSDPGFALTHQDPRMSIGIRTARYSYVRYADRSSELYDLWKDPLEMDNVADSPGYASVRAALDQVWEQNKTCSGPDCHTPLPSSLQVSAGSNAAHTDGYWSAVRDAYGY